jgi:hypothetical protein
MPSWAFLIFIAKFLTSLLSSQTEQRNSQRFQANKPRYPLPNKSNLSVLANNNELDRKVKKQLLCVPSMISSSGPTEASIML